MAADITIVAAGIMAAAHPGMADEAQTSLPLPEPVALEQAEPAAPVSTERLSAAISQLTLPTTITASTAPDFSPGAIAPVDLSVNPSIESLAEVTAMEAQLINQQLGQAPISISVKPAIATQASEGIAPATATDVAQQETRQLQQQLQGQDITHNIPVPTAVVALKRNTNAITPPPSSSPSPVQRAFERHPQERALALDRFEAQLIRNQAQRPATPRSTKQPQFIEVSTAASQRSLSPERQILAQVMMDSAEAQFLESNGLGHVSTTEASPKRYAQGSDPALEENVVQDEIGQVTSVSQLRDVQPTDWAYQATQSLVERYGCAAGYPDSSFRGNRALSRYEFAAGLNACLDRVTELLPIAGLEGGFAAQEDLAIAQQLAEQFQTELEQVRNSITSLEQRQADLEARQFSTTTKLYGQTLFGLRGSNNNGVDLFPIDGNPERSGAGDVTLGGSSELTLATSFRGNDLLLTTLQAGNIASSASTQFTNMGRLAYENDTDNQFILSDLSYRFAATPSLGVIIGSHGVNPTNTFRGISPLEGSGDGAISRLGQRNPLLELGSGGGGAGFDWQVARNVSLQGVYSATSPNQAGNDSGLFNGGYVAGGQVSAGLGRSADLGVHYLHSYSPNGALGTGIGDAQVLSPFAPQGSSFRTHAVGATAAWRPTQALTVGGWGGWTSSTPTELLGTVQTTNWMGFAQVQDLFQRGNALGLLVGQPPKITSSNLPVGFNFPEFSDGGGKGGQRDTALHLEAFYRAQLNDHLSVTPGIVVVRNPNHNGANDTLVVGAMRTMFRF